MLGSPLVWIAASMAAYALVTNVAWAAKLEPQRFSSLQRWAGLLPPSYSASALQVAHIAYFFGFPLLALGMRVGRPVHWGLALPPSPRSAMLAVAVAVAGIAIIGGGDLWLDRAAGRDRPIGPVAVPANVLAALALAALLSEAHWAFFRTGPLSIGLRNTTLAVFLSLGLVALESWSNPWRRAAFDDVRDCRSLALTAGLAVQSAAVYLVTWSSVMCLATHLAAVCVLASLSPRGERRSRAGR